MYLSSGESAVFERCVFRGGSGSAITVLNDPACHVPRVELLGNTFLGCGQTSISGADIAPAPAVVELWRLHRNCRCSTRSHVVERYQETQFRMESNHFSNNMQVPFAYRGLVARQGIWA